MKLLNAVTLVLACCCAMATRLPGALADRSGKGGGVRNVESHEGCWCLLPCDSNATWSYCCRLALNEGSAEGGSRSLEDLIALLPKAELHVHLEGTLEPEMMLAFGRRNNISLPYANAQAARAARVNYTSLEAGGSLPVQHPRSHRPPLSLPKPPPLGLRSPRSACRTSSMSMNLGSRCSRPSKIFTSWPMPTLPRRRSRTSGMWSSFLVSGGALGGVLTAAGVPGSALALC